MRPLSRGWVGGRRVWDRVAALRREAGEGVVLPGGWLLLVLQPGSGRELESLTAVLLVPKS